MTCASWQHPCKAQAWLTRQSRDGDWSKRRGLLICRVLVSLACRRCNRGERGKSYREPSAPLVAWLHERNNWLVDSHHLREPIILQTGVDADRRASFLRGRRQVAVDALIHEREPAEGADDSWPDDRFAHAMAAATCPSGPIPGRSATDDWASCLVLGNAGRTMFAGVCVH